MVIDYAWSYWIAFDQTVVSHAEMQLFLNSRREILTCQSYFFGTFLVVSQETALGIADLILQYTTVRRGRFVVLDTKTDRHGWLPKAAWETMKNPTALIEGTEP